MIQLYFLSILCNSISGYVLFSGKEGEEGEEKQFPANSPTFLLVLGILSAVTGVLKLLSPVKTVILGDLLPAAGGILAGLVLIFGIYRKNNNTSIPESSLDGFATGLLRFRKPLGLGLLAVAVLHFLFPTVILF